jgi:V/A-type H+-transporting ATPase subunit B
MIVQRIHHGAHALAGSLLYVEDTARAALGEMVTIRAAGQPARRGQVIDAGAGVSVIQILEDPLGLSPASAEIVLTGETASVPVGREMLGRVLSGVGAPLDGLPAPIGETTRPVYGLAMNPSSRTPPDDFIETGISAIDGLATLVRGQKLPVFSGAGLPALELAAQVVEHARVASGAPFAVVFAAIGITARETRQFVDRFSGSRALERTVLYLNETRDPTIEQLLAPRFALAQAEHLAFDHGMHVLVVMADLAHYCETLRQVAAARDEVPGRRGYPGYMYTDLASLFERSGVLASRTGSVTQLPIVTMPDDDITHPIPDLTGYITEGQIVLSRSLHGQGIYPPIDVLPSLSRLMNAGIGANRTVREHRRWADQLYALYARGRDARLMASIVGEAGLGDADRRARDFATRFEAELVAQGSTRRTLADTIEIGWRLLEAMPRDELERIDDETWARRTVKGTTA